VLVAQTQTQNHEMSYIHHSAERKQSIETVSETEENEEDKSDVTSNRN